MTTRIGSNMAPLEIAIIARGPTYCAVCASRTADGYAVEEEVRRRVREQRHWKVVDGPMLDGKPNPRCCPHDAARRHWLVVRSENLMGRQ